MQQPLYGLIGGKLGHSYSKIIHEKIADYTYELLPLPTELRPAPLWKSAPLRPST